MLLSARLGMGSSYLFRISVDGALQVSGCKRCNAVSSCFLRSWHVAVPNGCPQWLSLMGGDRHRAQPALSSYAYIIMNFMPVLTPQTSSS